MCFYASLTFRKIIGNKLFGATFRRKDLWDPLYFISGFDHPALPVIAADNRSELQLMQWGLVPHFVKSMEEASKISNLTLNARAETISTKPSFKRAVAQGRCIIPLTGFFEWQHANGKKIPYFVHPYNEEVMAVAGVYDTWDRSAGIEPLTSFSIITIDADAQMAQIHNTTKRMPVILSSSRMEEWLNPTLPVVDAVQLLAAAEEGIITAHRINPDLLKAGRNRNIPEIIEPFNVKD